MTGRAIQVLALIRWGFDMSDKDNIISFTGITTLPIDPARILAEASKQQFANVMVIGFLEDGSEYTACSDPDGSMALWMMERAKLKLLRMGDV